MSEKKKKKESVDTETQRWTYMQTFRQTCRQMTNKDRETQ